ncbi:MAG TPA: chemotaxis protein CheX [Methylomirabilota bacterium]|nr:chemotaxis protein CheX [Methylomirabilota bacterium]
MHFICDFTQKAVAEVCSTMFTLKATPVASGEGLENARAEFSGIVGSVSFAGKISGAVYIGLSDALACTLAERLLGSRPATANSPEVADLIGEIANMVSGDMKRRTAEIGYNGLLAPPVVMHGPSIVVEPREAHIAAYNQFRIPELNEEFGVQVFAKLQA